MALMTKIVSGVRFWAARYIMLVRQRDSGESATIEGEKPQMRHLIWIAMLLGGQAHAAFLNVDFSSSSVNAGGWTFPSAPPSMISGSLLLDTSHSASFFRSFTDSSGTTCVNNVRSTMSGSLTDLSFDGASMFSGGGILSFSGDTPGSCNPSQQFYFSGLSIELDDLTLSFSLDTIHPISYDELFAAADPLAALLTGATVVGAGFMFFGNEDGAGQAILNSFTIQNVPEPRTLGMFVFGLFGIGVARYLGRRAN